MKPLLRTTSFPLIALLTFLAAWASPCRGAFDMFLKLEEPTNGALAVEGEAETVGFEKQIELYAFSWGANNTVVFGSGAGGAGTGKGQFSSLNVSKPYDKSSPLLMQTCMAGGRYKKATLTLLKTGNGPGRKDFLVCEMSTVFVESVNISGSGGGDDKPAESISFTFGAIRASYRPTKEDGTLGDPIVGQWNVITNTANYGSSKDEPVPPGAPPVVTGTEVRVEDAKKEPEPVSEAEGEKPQE
ncbi:type VI secretion system tube protein Hcp [Candidatus Poribacteria bacterium]|nr:type VI secretion system tube protein Hcp [Candidatus Poribacteria bacterium]